MSELEDVLYDGMRVGRFFPYAHIILTIVATRSQQEGQLEELRSRESCFPVYRPAMPNDRRRGQRAIRAARQGLTPEQ
jgi:hypothetical protein